MSNTAKRLATVAAEDTESQVKRDQEARQQEVKMQVLKPEPKPEPEPEPTPRRTQNIDEIKRVTRELNYLAEQHDNLMSQLEKVQQFAAEVGEEATLKLYSNGVHSYASKDPAAVSAMVEICISNLKQRIADVELKLKA